MRLKTVFVMDFATCRVFAKFRNITPLSNKEKGGEMVRSYLKTKEIQQAITEIRQVRTSNIDGEILANMAEICHECALKNHEVRGLNIGHVSKSGIAQNSIKIKNDYIPISETAQGIVQNHIDHLKKTGHRLYPGKPLFPQKKSGLRYTNKTFNNHIDECLKNIDSGVRLENIRQAGIRNYNKKLLKQGIPADECLDQTADFARVDKKDSGEMQYLKNLLDYKIPGTGKKAGFGFYIGKIEEAYNHRRKNNDLIWDQLERIKYGISNKQKYKRNEILDSVWGELKSY